MKTESDVKVFGFWIYLMTDLIIFAVLFAVFIILRNCTHGGPGGSDLFKMPAIVFETLVLLVSSFTCSLATLYVMKKQRQAAFFWYLATFALGTLFLYSELSGFKELIHEGASWQRSAFLSSFFTLVGTHGLHIAVGLLWIVVCMYQVLFRPIVSHMLSQIYRMAFFWHFLDFVWIFIFSVVYGMELLSIG